MVYKAVKDSKDLVPGRSVTGCSATERQMALWGELGTKDTARQRDSPIPGNTARRVSRRANRAQSRALKKAVRRRVFCLQLQFVSMRMRTRKYNTMRSVTTVSSKSTMRTSGRARGGGVFYVCQPMCIAVSNTSSAFDVSSAAEGSGRREKMTSLRTCAMRPCCASIAILFLYHGSVSRLPHNQEPARTRP